MCRPKILFFLNPKCDLLTTEAEEMKEMSFADKSDNIPLKDFETAVAYPHDLCVILMEYLPINTGARACSANGDRAAMNNRVEAPRKVQAFKLESKRPNARRPKCQQSRRRRSNDMRSRRSGISQSYK